MTSAIGDGLAALTFQLAEMCAMASQEMEHATHALLLADIEAAQAVIALHEHTAAMSSSADETAFLLLTVHPPSAADLRQIVNGIRIVGDAERMAELAVGIAEIARRHHPDSAVPEEVRGRVAELSASAVRLARAVQEVLVSREPRPAVRRCGDGSAATELHRRLLATLIDPGWTHDVATGVELAEIARLYRGFADHALHIAERFVFQTNGHRVSQLQSKGKQWSRIAGLVG